MAITVGKGGAVDWDSILSDYDGNSRREKMSRLMHEFPSISSIQIEIESSCDILVSASAISRQITNLGLTLKKAHKDRYIRCPYRDRDIIKANPFKFNYLKYVKEFLNGDPELCKKVEEHNARMRRLVKLQEKYPEVIKESVELVLSQKKRG